MGRRSVGGWYVAAGLTTLLALIPACDGEVPETCKLDAECERGEMCSDDGQCIPAPDTGLDASGDVSADTPEDAAADASSDIDDDTTG